MAKFKCKNFGSCSLADAGKEFEIAPGGDDKCTECAMTLAPLQGGVDPRPPGKLKFIIAGVVIVAVALAVDGYLWRGNNKVVELTPESAPPSTASTANVSVTPPVSEQPAQVPTMVAPASHSEVNVGETSARMTCDDATKANRPDAEKICRRAAAVTLLNSGAQAAVAGKLDQAEKDYAAAKEKDADIPELYFNLAILKARQGKSAEVIDNLTLAVGKGFKQTGLIASEPLFTKLSADRDFKVKLDKLLSVK